MNYELLTQKILKAFRKAVAQAVAEHKKAGRDVKLAQSGKKSRKTI